MRTALAIGILALLAGGCAPAAPLLDLVPRDPAAPWQAGERWVGVESDRATINASFDRAWLDHLVFDVEVVNQSDSMLTIDPRQFSFTLTSSDTRLPRALRRRFTAEDPRKVASRLQHEVPHQSGFSDGLLGLAAFVVGVVVLAAVVASDIELSSADDSGDEHANSVQDVAAMQRAQAEDFTRSCRHSAETLLRPTGLAPHETVRGEIWFPIGPLRQAIGPPPLAGDKYNITTTPPKRAAAEYELTLRPPANTGALAIEYYVSR